jgi:hypothetical protein
MEEKMVRRGTISEGNKEAKKRNRGERKSEYKFCPFLFDFSQAC